MMLYRLGVLPWQQTQAVYHALAEVGREGLIFCRPAQRYVCLGFHDDLKEEVNIDFCQQQAIPLIRRETGGGMVLLDQNQIFFQLILHRSNPLLKGRRDQFFQQFLAPAVAALQDFGLSAAIQPPADIVVNGRKISGNGAGDINDYAVYIGNILIGFDRETMANVLQVPYEEFRKSARQSMDQYMTTLSEELGYQPDVAVVESRLLEHFKAWMPELESGAYFPELENMTEKIALRLTSREFLQLPGKRQRSRQVKIKENVYLRLHRYTDDSGEGWAIIQIKDHRISHFETHNIACLQQAEIIPLAPYMQGIPWQEAAIETALQQWEKEHRGKLPGLDHKLLMQWILTGI
ncbi:MAG: biotin/lipoate A/B protein ligase family protein [Veillonellales bacterium]